MMMVGMIITFFYLTGGGARFILTEAFQGFRWKGDHLEEGVWNRGQPFWKLAEPWCSYGGP